MTDTAKLTALAEAVKTALPEAVIATRLAMGEQTLMVERTRIADAVKFLRDSPAWRFKILIDICGADYPDRAERFDVVYHLLSVHNNLRVRLKTAADGSSPVPSIVGIFPAANWYEREAYDLYGILFEGHPDLRRLLTDYGFRGHPLRKDFPLTGFVEVRYDEEQKRVVYEPVKLPQEFRTFDFLSPWEGGQYEPLPGDEKAASQQKG
ncbi:MAG: NADH-quinone oxidoreductase subunit C [Rhodomicrobium sp.]